MIKGFDDLVFNAGKSFDQILADFGKFLANMAIKAAFSQFFSMLFPAATGMATAGMPGSPFFGPPAPGGSGGGLFGWIGSLFQNRQGGGPVFPGQSYVVGEHGPERFVPAVAGNINPHAAVSTGDVTINVDMGSQAGGPNVQQTTDFARKVRQAVVDTIQNEKRPGGTLYTRMA